MSDLSSTSWIFGGPVQGPSGQKELIPQTSGAGLEPRSQATWPLSLDQPAPLAAPAEPRFMPPPVEPPRAAGSRNAVAAEIETLIRARYPLLEIISWEEERVLRCLGGIAQTLRKDIWHWTVNGGLCRYRGQGVLSGEGAKGTKDPLIVLKEIAANSGTPSIFVLKDFHPFMKEANVVRALRDLSISLRSTYSTVVLLGPDLVVPSELEKDLTVIDFPMPDRHDMQEFINQFARDIAENPALHFDDNEETRQRLMDAAAGLTMNEIENAFAKILVRHGRLTAAEVPEVYHEKAQILRKTGLLDYIDPQESIEWVGGLKSLKEWLRKRRRAFHPKARQFGLPAPKGVLFLGVQGCGKSLCAKAVSRFWQLPLLRLDMGTLFGPLVGESEKSVRRMIHILDSLAPAIVWIDEIDKGFSGLGKGADSDAGTASRVFGTFLTWLQEKSAPVFVIATANQVEVLPPELMRQGRFDEIFFVDLPGIEERKDIFKIHLAIRKRNPARFDLDKLAEASEGFSGAEIEQSVISGLHDAFDKQKDIDQEILMEALAATRPLSVLMSEEIKRRRQWAKGRTRPAS